MARLLLAIATTAALVATAAPAANACDLEYCPGTSIVCRQVSCDRPILIGCEQPLGMLQVCI